MGAGYCTTVCASGRPSIIFCRTSWCPAGDCLAVAVDNVGRTATVARWPPLLLTALLLDAELQFCPQATRPDFALLLPARLLDAEFAGSAAWGAGLLLGLGVGIGLAGSAFSTACGASAFGLSSTLAVGAITFCDSRSRGFFEQVTRVATRNATIQTIGPLRAILCLSAVSSVHASHCEP